VEHGGRSIRKGADDSVSASTWKARVAPIPRSKVLTAVGCRPPRAGRTPLVVAGGGLVLGVVELKMSSKGRQSKKRFGQLPEDGPSTGS